MRILHVTDRLTDRGGAHWHLLGLIEETRRNWPFLRDRRIDAYVDIGKRFRD